MRRSILALLFLTIPLLASAQPGNTMRSGKALGLFQTVGLSEDGYPSSFIARLGVYQYANDTGLSLSKNSTSIDPAGAVGIVPYVPYNPLSLQLQTDLLSNAKAYQQYAITHTLSGVFS